MLRELWEITEEQQTPRFPAFYWKRALGDRFEAALPYLRFVEMAEVFPCPSPGGKGCPRLVVRNSLGLHASCGKQPRTCDSIRLEEDDIPTYELRGLDLAEAVASALGASGPITPHPLSDSLWSLGMTGEGRHRSAAFLGPLFDPGLEVSTVSLQLAFESDSRVTLVVPRRRLRFSANSAIARRAGIQVIDLESILDRESATAPSAEVAAFPASFERLLMTRCGSVWRLQFSGDEATVATGRGFDYLGLLCESPGRAFRATELLEAVSGERLGLGSAGEAIDEAGSHLLKKRAAELAAELEEAHAIGSERSIDRIRTELEAIAEHLAKARGLRGRRRRVSDDVQRVRNAVSMAIRRAVTTLEKELPSAAEHLRSSLELGLDLSYRPVEILPFERAFARA